MNAQNSKSPSIFRWLGVGCSVAALIVIVVQRQMISELRDTKSAQSVESEMPEERAAAPVAASENPENLSELLRLRHEVHQLREQVVLLRSGTQPPTTQQAAPVTVAADNQLSQIVSNAMAGDLAALKQLAELSAIAHAQFRTNQDHTVFAGLRSAFDEIGAEAGKGSATALEALVRASRMEFLGGFAVQALGKAAGQGNEQALEPLLDPERYFILKSSAVGALKPAADAGNARAIQGIAIVAADPKAQALWLVAAQGLQGAAKAGNATAIDALAGLVRAENQTVRRAAFVALETAAIDQQRAAEAVRRLQGQ